MTDTDTRTRDNARAVERMRRLRAAGPTVADRARNAAVRDLIEAHRAEFDRMVREHTRWIERGE